VPKTRAQGYLYVVLPDSGTEPLGHRIIETPASTERHELHDPNETFVTYVPRGSLTRGRAIATKGGGVTTACVTCHGPDLRGVGVIPPLAGRSPTYIVRQLAGFRTGTRSTTATQPMSLVTANMGDDDMIAVAAYIATRRP
jgi:cytochrome c553